MPNFSKQGGTEQCLGFPSPSFLKVIPKVYYHFKGPYQSSLKKIVNLNPITYVGGGFLAWTIRLSTTILKRLYLVPPNLVTFCFYLLDTFWQNFSKIDSPGGLLQLFLK